MKWTPLLVMPSKIRLPLRPFIILVSILSTSSPTTKINIQILLMENIWLWMEKRRYVAFSTQLKGLKEKICWIDPRLCNENYIDLPVIIDYHLHPAHGRGDLRGVASSNLNGILDTRSVLNTFSFGSLDRIICIIHGFRRTIFCYQF